MRAFSFIVFLILSYGAGGIGGFFTLSSLETWHAALNKPAFNPPNWIFAPVWNTLFGMMAIAGWLVWITATGPERRLAMILFAMQLVLNTGWTAVFFGLRLPGWGLVEIGVLWGVILWTLVVFWRIRPLAGVLLVPYLAWVTFAVALNFMLWYLNRP